MIMGQASKAIAAKWRNLSLEERAVFETKASQANAEPLQLVRQFDSEKRAEACSKLLSQIGKSLELLEAMGWSYMFAGINADTNATFKEIKGTPAKLANAEYVSSGMDLLVQLTAGQVIAKKYPSVAKSVEMNKSVQQGHMEHLALISLNGCLAEQGLKPYNVFPWIQVQSKHVFNRSFHFVNWPANIPLKRSLTIEECEIVIRMFERQDIRGSLGVDQAEGTETPKTPSSFSADIESRPEVASEAELGGEDFLNLLD
ncbi:hypothetical protein HDU81_009862 [Chytriomyces hyalinus]|nr:hypothetical protein HDU81_009862 [Chytriomyces hyalinus]